MARFRYVSTPISKHAQKPWPATGTFVSSIYEILIKEKFSFIFRSSEVFNQGVKTWIRMLDDKDFFWIDQERR